MMLPQLSILDFSPFCEGKSAKTAISETVILAKHADQLGYRRYWLAEHHNNADFAGTSPEILITHLASQTKHLRIGSGGILLPHYSPYRIAERFLLLENLFPNRIDLGLCRSFGMKADLANFLFPNSSIESQTYSQQLDDLLILLKGEFTFNESKLNLADISDTRPEVWMLGSSEQAMDIASKKGINGAFAHFINPHLTVSLADSMKKLKQNCMAMVVICAESRKKAEQLRNNALKMGLQRLKGNSNGLPYCKENEAFVEQDLKQLEQLQQGIISGTPKEVKRQLLAFSEKYHLNEVLCIPLIYELEDRKRSLSLLKEVCSF